MAFLFPRDNDALNVNPPAGDQRLTVHGSDWLWAVTAVFALTFLALTGLTYVARGGERIFHYLFIIAAWTGMVAYFAMASDLGWSLIYQADNRDTYGPTRQIFFAKYIFWVVSFPVSLIALGLLSGISWATIFFNVALSWAWVLSYLVAAYTTTNYKWGFFVFGLVAHLLVLANTLFDSRRSSARVGVSGHYSALAGWLNLLWLLYPIAWGLSDGGNRMGVTQSFIFFGILDILMIPVLGFAFVFLSRKWDYNRLNIAFTQYGRVQTAPGTYPEKHHGTAATGAHPTTAVV